MTSPFPGMDPYLEGYLWPDVHHNIASLIQELLAPQITPKYVARLNRYVVIDTEPDDVGIMYPDVDVSRKQQKAQESQLTYGEKETITPVTTRIPSDQPIEVRIPVVEIHDREGNQLVTAIEVLSPISKRSPGLTPYREKRMRLIRSGVNLMEIDLIRRGKRPFSYPYLPSSHYLAALTRAGSDRTDIWAFNVQDPLPVLPVPLKTPDEDAVLNLRKALDTIYQRGIYELSIDYQQAPPPPEFSEKDQKWVRQWLKDHLSKESDK